MECKFTKVCKGASGLSAAMPVHDLPHEVQLELLSKCNLSCQFCYKSDRSDPGLPLSSIFTILRNIKSSGIAAVRLTGGEPLLRTDFSDIVRFAKDLGLYVILNTNATIRIPADAAALIDQVLISIHDPQQVVGKLMFIETLRSDIKVDICTILTAKNIAGMEIFYSQIIPIIRQNPQVSWFFLRPVNTKGMNLFDKDKAKAALNSIFYHNQRYKSHIKIHNAIPFCLSDDPKSVRSICVGAIFDDGRSSVFISSKGLISPSYFISHTLGSALSMRLIDAWNTEAMRQLREFEVMPDECKGCPYLQECMGGLRHEAKEASGSYVALDPIAAPENLKKAYLF